MKLLRWQPYIYSAAIIFLCLQSNIKIQTDFTSIDKVYHVTAFFLMFIVWYLGFYAAYTSKYPEVKWRLALMLQQYSSSIAYGALFISLLIGGIIELAQGYLVQGRSMEWADMFANVTGALLGWCIILAFKKKNH